MSSRYARDVFEPRAQLWRIQAERVLHLFESSRDDSQRSVIKLLDQRHGQGRRDPQPFLRWNAHPHSRRLPLA
jgi:hypothetical protein